MGGVCMRRKSHERTRSAAGEKLSHPLSIVQSVRVNMKQIGTDWGRTEQNRVEGERKNEVEGQREEGQEQHPQGTIFVDLQI